MLWFITGFFISINPSDASLIYDITYPHVFENQDDDYFELITDKMGDLRLTLFDDRSGDNLIYFGIPITFSSVFLNHVDSASVTTTLQEVEVRSKLQSFIDGTKLQDYSIDFIMFKHEI